METVYDQDALAAAEACFAQASRLVYCEPDTETVAAQVADRLFQVAPYGMEDGHVREGLALMDAWCVQAAAERADADPGADADAAAGEASVGGEAFAERVAALKREWLRLFVGAGTPEAPCWESFYVEPNSPLFGRTTLEVREAYRRRGLQVERLHAEPDDHLGLMLGFVSHLIGAEADARAAGDEAAAAAAAREQEEFLVQHVLPWLAAWRYSALKHASSDYYRGAADFAFGLCACYAGRFGVAFDQEAQAFKRSHG